MKVPTELLPAISMMIDDLESQRLEVVLVPARRGDGMVRTVESTNPEWYQELCANHCKQRRNPRKRLGKKHLDTKIVRGSILSVLRRMLRTGSSPSIYAEELLGYAQAIAAAHEEAELQELGLSRSQMERLEEAPF